MLNVNPLIGTYHGKGKEMEIKYYPEKYKAHYYISMALQKRILTRPEKCSSCDNKKFIVAHHENYFKPLEVIWVCRSCHLRIHGKKKLSKYIPLREKIRIRYKRQRLALQSN